MVVGVVGDGDVGVGVVGSEGCVVWVIVNGNG